MSLQRLSPKTLRRVSRATGIGNIKHGVARGGYTYWLTTYDHRHFWYYLKTGEWGYDQVCETGRAFSSCPGGGTDDGVWSKDNV